MKRFLCPVSLVALAVLTVSAGERGDLWETTSQMTMEGMPAGMGMPAQTRRVCSAREWTKPPVASDDRTCETVDFQGGPQKATWKMKCQDGMSGEGEITRSSSEAYTGWIKMRMPQGTMTMNLTGKRVGDCDAGEAKAQIQAEIATTQKQLAQSEKMAADATEQACMGSATSLDVRSLQAMAVMCPGPKYQAAFCDSLNSYDGFKKVCNRDDSDPDNSMASLAKLCRADVTAMKRVGCAEAVKKNDLTVIGDCCPTEAQAIALEHCAGRSYTSAGPDGYGGFCRKYAQDVMEGGAKAPAKKAGKSGR